MYMYANEATCSIPDWHKLFLAFRFRFFSSYSFFWFRFVVFRSLLLPSRVGSGAFWTRLPSPLEGWVTLLRRAHQTFVWCSTAVEYPPVLGTVSPRDKFCPRKSGTPQNGLLENQQGSRKYFPFRFDRKHPSGVLAVLFPFFREAIHQFPLRVQAVSPLPEKNSKTQAVLARSRLGPQEVESSPTFNFAKHDNLEFQTPGYWFGHRNPCGMDMTSCNTRTHAPWIHCACAK